MVQEDDLGLEQNTSGSSRTSSLHLMETDRKQEVTPLQTKACLSLSEGSDQRRRLTSDAFH